MTNSVLQKWNGIIHVPILYTTILTLHFTVDLDLFLLGIAAAVLVDTRGYYSASRELIHERCACAKKRAIYIMLCK